MTNFRKKASLQNFLEIWRTHFLAFFVANLYFANIIEKIIKSISNAKRFWIFFQQLGQLNGHFLPSIIRQQRQQSWNYDVKETHAVHISLADTIFLAVCLRFRKSYHLCYLSNFLNEASEIMSHNWPFLKVQLISSFQTLPYKGECSQKLCGLITFILLIMK